MSEIKCFVCECEEDEFTTLNYVSVDDISGENEWVCDECIHDAREELYT